MRRILWSVAFLAVALPGWAPLAAGQVAVPEIAPAGVRIFSSRQPIAPMVGIVPENPAALQWGAPSRLTVGSLQGKQGDAIDGTATAYDGSLAGFRWVELRVALAAEAADFAVDFPVRDGVTPRLEREQRTLALSFSWPESLAFGIGSEQGRRRTVIGPPPAGGVVEEFESDGWVTGVSWRIGQGFFLGAGYGNEELTRIAPLPEVVGERSHTMYGIGLRGTGWLVWHLEADFFRREDVEVAGVPVQPGQGYELTLFNAEAIWGAWLFGVAAYEAQPLNPPPGNPKVEGYTVDFGLVPFSGLTVSGRFEHSEQSTDTFESAKEEINSVVIGWQF